MKETIELRIPEDEASRHLDPNLGVRLGDTVRKVSLRSDDPLVAQIANIQRAYRRRGREFFLGWRIRRRYSRAELKGAELLRLQIVAVFEPSGEECGTKYDESRTCPKCGVGRVQRTPLSLEVASIPKGRDLAQTIGGEIVVSADFGRALEKGPCKGFELHPVIDSSTGKESREYSQLTFTSRPLQIGVETRAGIDPFDSDDRGEYVCPKGHVLGLNLVSELQVDRQSWDGSDLCRTKQYIGVRRGLLVPEPLVVISQKCYGLLSERESKGFLVEKAHLA